MKEADLLIGVIDTLDLDLLPELCPIFATKVANTIFTVDSLLVNYIPLKVLLKIGVMRVLTL